MRSNKKTRIKYYFTILKLIYNRLEKVVSLNGNALKLNNIPIKTTVKASILSFMFYVLFL